MKEVQMEKFLASLRGESLGEESGIQGCTSDGVFLENLVGKIEGSSVEM